MANVEKYDHPIVLLLALFLGIVALFALTRWLFASLGWTGPLGLVTMGTSHTPHPNGGMGQ